MLDTAAVAAASLLVWTAGGASSRVAAAATSGVLLVFAWGRWKVGRVQARWRKRRREHQEQLDAAPAVTAAVVFAVGGLWWAARDYTQTIAVVAVGLVAAGMVAVAVAVVRRRRATPMVAASAVLSPTTAVAYKAGGFDPRTNELRAIKFGFSTVRGLPRRMRDLTSDTGNPYHVRLIAYGPGGRRREAGLHRKYAAYRMKGEWFALDAGVVAEPFEVEVLDVAELKVAA